MRCGAGRRPRHGGTLLLALPLAGGEALAARQQAEIAARLDADTGLQAQRIHQQLTADLHPMLRLPLAALAFPVLRQRPRPQLDAFLDAVDAVVHADGDVSLFEYCLARLLRVHVRGPWTRRATPAGRRKPGSVRREFATLLALFAQAGRRTTRPRGVRTLPASARAAARPPAVCATGEQRCRRPWVWCGSRWTHWTRWPSR